ALCQPTRPFKGLIYHAWSSEAIAMACTVFDMAGVTASVREGMGSILGAALDEVDSTTSLTSNATSMNPASWTSAKPTAGGLLSDDYYSCLVAAEAASSQEQRYDSTHGRGSDDLILPENYAGYLKSYSKPEKVEEPPPPVARGSGGSTTNTRGIGAPSPLRERAGLERKRKRDQARQYKSKMRSKVRQMLKKQA
ncbi:hypothetical protein FOZ63_009182, partial [Perkinsus olseni]